MTQFKHYPHQIIHLPFDGKVTGWFEMWSRGDGSVGARTEAEAKVAFRGEEYTFHLDLKRQEDGSFETYGPRTNLIERGWFNPAPPSYAKIIMAAVIEAVEREWTPEFDRLGLEADVSQHLHRLESDLRDAEARVKAAKSEIESQRARLNRAEAKA